MYSLRHTLPSAGRQPRAGGGGSGPYALPTVAAEASAAIHRIPFRPAAKRAAGANWMGQLQMERLEEGRESLGRSLVSGSSLPSQGHVAMAALPPSGSAPAGGVRQPGDLARERPQPRVHPVRSRLAARETWLPRTAPHCPAARRPPSRAAVVGAGRGPWRAT